MAPVAVTGACALLLGLSKLGEKGAEEGTECEGVAGSVERSEEDVAPPAAVGDVGVGDKEEADRPKSTASRDCW